MNLIYEERKYIFDYMKLLVLSEQEEIYRIIRKSKETYTENSNGIFFDLLHITDDTFCKIKKYITFCIKTRQEDDIRLKVIDDIRNKHNI